MIKEAEKSSNNYLIKQLPTATAFLDQNLNIVHASDKWISDFAFESQDVYGKALLDLFGSISTSWKTSLEDCLKGLCSTNKKEKILDSDGNTQYFECSTMPWYDSSENIIGVIINTSPSTANPDFDLDRDKLQLLLKTQSEISKIGSWEYNVKTDKLFWCSMTKIIHGVPQCFHPTVENALNFYKDGYSRNTISLAFHKALANGEPWNEKLKIIAANGAEKWVLAAGKPIIENDEIISIIGTFQDIHDQVQYENNTKERETLLKTLIDNLPLNVYIKDINSQRILVNKSECHYLGFNQPEEVIGKNDHDFFELQSANNSREEDLRVLNSLEPMLSEETICVKKNGEVTPFLSSKIPLKGENGKAYGLVGISMDISNLKQKEESLRNLIHVTSLQNKKLINFAHIVSHNLRSHAANFAMLLDFMVEENDTEEKNKITGMLVNASNNLMETLNNLNEVVAISRNLKREKSQVNLNQTITKVLQGLRESLEVHNAEITNTIADNTYVKAIPDYLENILTNFITNAVTFSRPGIPPSIKLSATVEDHFVVLQIEDNGQGIDLKKHGDKLFGMYKTFHDNKDGKGMGLYICNNQIEAMNGKIVTESTVGKGTTFKIYFNETGINKF